MAKIDVKVDYDKEADVLYITLGTGEASYCEEVDDILLVERGFLTNRITGFRILDVRHHKIKQVQVWIRKIEKILEKNELPFRDAYTDVLRRRLQSNRLQNMIYA